MRTRTTERAPSPIAAAFRTPAGVLATPEQREGNRSMWELQNQLDPHPPTAITRRQS